jgi:hypothetical protein
MFRDGKILSTAAECPKDSCTTRSVLASNWIRLPQHGHSDGLAMPGTNMLIFRDGAKQVPGRSLANRLTNCIAKVGPSNEASVFDALLIAGEIECALSDFGHAGTDGAIQLADSLAALFVKRDGSSGEDLNFKAQTVISMLPDMLRISHPEGFVYYALHPGDFADVANQLPSNSFAVVGIRSIGTTLSAVTTAALRARGLDASRITVRPTGHPYDRQTHFSDAQRLLLAREAQRGSKFLVVDEGPGLSGSSFLSVAESIADLGVADDRIILVGTREVDPMHLCARDAARRWKRFSWQKASSRIYDRFQETTSLSGGRWRNLFLPSWTKWPASWQEMETLKFWSRDQHSVLKFDGLGEPGNMVRERARVICKAGFGAEVQDAGDGMTEYRFVSGTPLARTDLCETILDRIADYCGFRAAEFNTSGDTDEQLRQMVRHNFFEETGRTLEFADDALAASACVICDGRMQPHEWLRTEEPILKIDGAMHGDDHFLPGPTDIAWDLAGAIVEWDMDRDAEQYFCSTFQNRSGKRLSNLPGFILAYAAFRMGYCKMALAGTQDPGDKGRFQKEYLYYREKMIKAATKNSVAA